MFNIMKLEMKKFNLKKHVINSLICTIAILLLSIPIVYIDGVKSYSQLFKDFDLMANSIFSIFEAVLIGNFIIKEFNNKTISILFTYPISRKKILLSKLALVVIITFLSIVVSTFICKGVAIISNLYIPFTTESVTLSIIIGSTFKSIMYALVTSCISLIPLYFGMIKKSISSTIVSSVILSIFLNGQMGNFSVAELGISDFFIKIAFAAIGIFIAYLSIRKIENLDF